MEKMVKKFFSDINKKFIKMLKERGVDKVRFVTPQYVDAVYINRESGERYVKSKQVIGVSYLDDMAFLDLSNGDYIVITECMTIESIQSIYYAKVKE